MKKYLCLSIFVFLSLVSIGLLAQEEHIYGKVTDKDDKPLVNVEVKNRYSGDFTKTDVYGNYRLYIKAKRMQIVEFSIEKGETQIEEFYLRKGDKREINVTFFGKGTITCIPPSSNITVRPPIKELVPFLPSITIEETQIKNRQLFVKRK